LELRHNTQEGDMMNREQQLESALAEALEWLYEAQANEPEDYENHELNTIIRQCESVLPQ
jgi:hypothetical protein